MMENIVFLNKTVARDKTWVCFETKGITAQYRQWKHSNSSRVEKLKQTFFSKKLMATVFWDSNSDLLVKFMEPGMNITTASYSMTLECLQRLF